MKEVDESGEFKYLIEKKVNSFLSKIFLIVFVYFIIYLTYLFQYFKSY